MRCRSQYRINLFAGLIALALTLSVLACTNSDSYTDGTATSDLPSTAPTTSTGAPIAMKRTIGGTDHQTTVRHIAVDTSGNLYISGAISNSSTNTRSALDFDDATILGKTTTVSTEAFIAKINTSGNVAWIKTLGGTGSDSSVRLDLDSSGNVYVTGSFVNSSSDTATATDFANNTLLGRGTSNVANSFLAKLNSSGVQQWIRVLGGNVTSGGNAVRVDSGDNAIVVGAYSNTLTDGSATVDFAGAQLLGKGTVSNNDGYVAKFNTNGTQLWINTIGGQSTDNVISVDVDSSDNIIVTGTYTNSQANGNNVVDYAGNAILGKSASVSFDTHLSLLNSSGVQQWIQTLGGSSSDTPTYVVVDQANSDVIYLAAQLQNSSSNSDSAVDFSGTTVLGAYTSSSVDIVLAKLSNSGTQSWIKVMGGSNTDFPGQIAIGSSGQVYMAGTYINSTTNSNSAIDFAGNTLLGKNSTTSNDTCFIEVSSAGTQQSIKTFGGAGNDVPRAVAVASNGRILVGGTFTNSSSNANSVLDFDGNTYLGKTSTNVTHGYFLTIEP